MIEVWAARAVTPRGLARDVCVRIEGTRIAAVETGSSADAMQRFPAGTLIPGLVDLQINGARGVDYSDPDSARRRQATEFHLRAGTTSVLPTLVSAPVSELEASLAALASDVQSQPELVGVHLEGPFLCAQKAGAHTRAHLQAPEPHVVSRLCEAAGGALSMVTLAPELPGALAAIERFAAAGAIVSAGHTLASLDEMRAAVACGLSFVTHVGNACDWPTRVFDGEVGYRRSEPGVIGAFLMDARLRGGVILDGHHLHPELARVLVEVRGRDALALVSDAAPLAGLDAGEHALWGMSVRVDPQGFATAGQGLVGGMLPLSGVLRVAVQRAGLSLVDAVHMASAVPAQVIGVGERKGAIRPGYDADLVVLDEELRPLAVYVGGRPVDSALS